MDYYDITEKDVQAFPGLNDVIGDAVSRRIKRETRQEFQDIVRGDYSRLEHMARAHAGVQLEFDLTDNTVPATRAALRDVAIEKYGNLATNEEPFKGILVYRNAHFVNNTEFLAIFSRPDLLEAVYNAYVDEYLKRAEEERQKTNLREILLFHMQYQPWAHLSLDEKKQQIEVVIQALSDLLASS